MNIQDKIILAEWKLGGLCHGCGSITVFSNGNKYDNSPGLKKLSTIACINCFQKVVLDELKKRKDPYGKQ